MKKIKNLKQLNEEEQQLHYRKKELELMMTAELLKIKKGMMPRNLFDFAFDRIKERKEDNVSKKKIPAWMGRFFKKPGQE
jgi:hypothetical protein